MNNDFDGAGCLAGLFVLAIPWGIFFYSGISLLVLRHEEQRAGAYVVQCRYINATGMEWPEYSFWNRHGAEVFYCPRWKHVGAN